LQIVDFRIQIDAALALFQSAIKNLKSAIAPACEEAIDRCQGEAPLPPAAVKRKKKGEHHASCKARNQTAPETQEDT
jgi:hypothetical protein